MAPWIPLAEVARPHGVKGELRLKLYNQDSDILLDQDSVLLRLKDGKEREVTIDRARRADDAILMKLHAIDDRDRADELRGAVLCVKRDLFPALDDGEFYVCDLEGAKVSMRKAERAESPDGTEGADGERLELLGVVRELRSYPSVEVLVVTASDGGKDWEIPLVDAFIERLDAAAGEVIVTSLEGLERG